jgi:hypothetical protein
LKTNDGGPAFPHAAQAPEWNGCAGMTLRDYFAAHAPTGDDGVTTPQTIKELEEFIGIPSGTYKWLVHWPIVVAKARYAYADAMLRERAK